MKSNKLIANLYLTNWFFCLLGISSSFFVVSFFFEFLFFYAQLFVALVFAYLFVDILILHASKSRINAKRDLKEQLNLGEDRHPEKRAKALFNQYFERRLPEMKEEKPGLKLMQYKEL